MEGDKSLVELYLAVVTEHADDGIWRVNITTKTMDHSACVEYLDSPTDRASSIPFARVWEGPSEPPLAWPCVAAAVVP
jgi:hypothetical protein